MPKKSYLPSSESDRKTFLDHLDDSLPGALATKYGISSDDLTRLHEFRLWNDWTATVLDLIRQKSQGFTAFRDDLCYGKAIPSGPLSIPPGLTLPPVPTSGTPPVAITPLANGFGFVSSLVARIKGHADYTTADGEVLGLEGAEVAAPDPATTKPELALVIISGGKVQVQWKKASFTGIRLEVDRGIGQWVFLDFDTKPHYEDPTPPPVGAAVWRYRAIYLQGDQVFGQWSDPVSIAVQG